MEVLIITIFVSLVLAALAVGFFAWGLKQGVYEHTDRLALMPLEEDRPPRDRESAEGGTQDERKAPSRAAGRKTCIQDEERKTRE